MLVHAALPALAEERAASTFIRAAVGEQLAVVTLDHGGLDLEDGERVRAAAVASSSTLQALAMNGSDGGRELIDDDVQPLHPVDDLLRWPRAIRWLQLDDFNSPDRLPPAIRNTAQTIEHVAKHRERCGRKASGLLDGSVLGFRAHDVMADELLRRAEARVGRSLHHKWKLDQLIGVGGMAAVYAATHRNGHRGAVKLLHLELSLEQDIRERFLREGYLANKVGHPGAVAVLDDDVAEDGSIYLVMELLEGVSLISLLDQQPNGVLALHAALGVIEQLLDVLASAHRAGIVHRDVKPENVFVTTEGRVKLLDFGIARLRETQSEWRTRTGHAMGTPAFMPPEQAAGKWAEVGPHSDVWAVGATLFNMLTGRTVHEAETVPILMVKAITMPAPSIASLSPEVPADIAMLVDRALAFEPSARFATAEEMRVAVNVSRALHPGASLRSLVLGAGEGMVAPETSEALTLPETKTLHETKTLPEAKTLPNMRRPARTGSLAKGLIGGVALSVLVGATWFIAGSDAATDAAGQDIQPSATPNVQVGVAKPSNSPSVSPSYSSAQPSAVPSVSTSARAVATGSAPQPLRTTTPTAKPAAIPSVNPYAVRKPPK